MIKKTIYILICMPLFIVTAYAQGTLPVELLYFKYKLENSKVLLEWETATETNNAGFYVERATDSTWDKLTFIPGNGNSNSPKYYSYKDTDVVVNKTYSYLLEQIDNSGDIKYSDTLVVSVVTGVQKVKLNIPSNFEVSQNYPNPFNPVTNINIKIAHENSIFLRIFNINGETVEEKNYSDKPAGEYVIQLDGSNWSSGVYFYSIKVGDRKMTKSMILLK